MDSGLEVARAGIEPSERVAVALSIPPPTKDSRKPAGYTSVDTEPVPLTLNMPLFVQLFRVKPCEARADPGKARETRSEVKIAELCT